ncbi:hypothetical protein HGRIS_010256 [Hohenbuehelia grisea]|uniref:Alpha/beta hydrolase fold-3 domain-containing protein n=1 Tax=Hohenbuehelia grisea TaxID=104357 RepID=A0ABR3J4C9_9AGAR
MKQRKLAWTYYQPLKGLYITARLLALLALVPSWTVYYTLFKRPRPSWTLKECVLVRLIHWIMPLNAHCGISPLKTSKAREVPQSELKESTFVWIEPADSKFVVGIAKDDKVLPQRIPGYVWPKGADIASETGLVGLWFHGGGYMMGNATESYEESNIPRLIQRHSKMKTILAVDYRLSSEDCHPAQLLDALSGYSCLVNTLGMDPARIVLLGACAGGHLVPLLMRYLYEEKVLPPPAAAMLFSPWLDMVIDFEIIKDQSRVRPNTEVDMLSSSHLANLLFLGHHSAEILGSPYLSANRTPSDGFKDYPPIFVSVGDAEAFKRECDELVDKLRKDGVDVTYDVQKDAAHDFWGALVVPNDAARARLAENVYQWLAELDGQARKVASA